MMQARATESRRVWKVEEDRRTEYEIELVREEPLSLRINGKQVAVLMRLPGMEKELAAGFCVSEGLVHSFADLLIIRHCGQGGSVRQGEGSRNQVDVQVRPEALNPDARLDVVRLIRAGCGAVDVDRSELALPRVADGHKVSLKVVQSLAATMREAQRLHRRVGGVHAAALFDAAGAMVILCEDVGRHNAVDKAVGYCLLRGLALTDKMLLCSGRLSYEMATKAIRMGLPLLVSVSAPTVLAVQLAEHYNMTLIGYLRGKRMTIYAHPERIAL